MGQENIKLSIATTDYDHFRDFRTGEVRAQGIDHSWSILSHHECFARFTANREWDVSELSFAKFSTQVTREDSDIVGLPVVCSRLFRFSSFYINKNAGIKTVEDLKGKRVGSPEWAHSAAVYMRGWMHNDCGVKLPDVHWYQAGANAPGRMEKVELNLPDGVEITRITDKSLSELLAAGEIDCAIIARPPTCFLEGHPDVTRLFPNYVEMEEKYYADTGVWPIMHIIAMQRKVLQENPWVARNLLNAFNESKKIVLCRGCWIQRCLGILCRGSPLMGRECVILLVRTHSHLGSRKTGQHGSKCSYTRTNRELHINTLNQKISFPKEL